MNTVSLPHSPATRRLLPLVAVAAALPLVPAAHAASFTWDGEGADGNTSTGLNWVGDIAPTATGNTLVFSGTNNLNVNNDSITSLGSASITFASGAGSFNISGNAFTVGNSAANDNFVTKISTNDQVISANVNLAGGGRDRTIIMSGGGTLTLGGNINFSNDWLFPTTSAGTIVLSGNNSGDGKGNIIVGGTNTMRAMLRNNVAGTVLTLGSDTALGNSGSGDASVGTANLRGFVANQNLTINTIGNRNLSGSSIGINTAKVTYNGADNLTIGNILTQGGNRDFEVTGAGRVTVSTGLFLDIDQTGGSWLFLNLSGTGGMEVNGKVHDTFHSGGLTSGTAILRKAGTGTLTLNGDSAYLGTTQIDAGTLKIGHANALGSTAGATNLTGGTLDLNGQTIGETLNASANSSLVNSSATAAAVTADANLTANLTIDTTGDITLTRLVGSGANRTVTKIGAGTLTTNGSSHNNLTAWNIQAGTVIFANTSGYGADRGVTLTGGTLRLSGDNNDLINDGQGFILGGGTLDLNGKSEQIGALTLADSTTSFIDFGSGTSVLLFSSIAGTGALNVLNWTDGQDSFRVTADASSLLGQITINGLAASITNMGSYYELSAAAIPEPSAFAALAGLGALGFVASRRRRA